MHENVSHYRDEEEAYKTASVKSEKKSKKQSKSKVDPTTGKTIIEI